MTVDRITTYSFEIFCHPLSPILRYHFFKTADKLAKRLFVNPGGGGQLLLRNCQPFAIRTGIAFQRRQRSGRLAAQKQRPLSLLRVLPLLQVSLLLILTIS